MLTGYDDLVTGFSLQVYLGHTEAVNKFLLAESNKADALHHTMSTFDNFTVLHLACLGAGNVETVEALVKHGANLRAASAHKRYPLHVAANAKDPRILKYILGQSGMASLITKPDNDGRNVLHALFLPGYRGMKGDQSRPSNQLAAFTILANTIKSAGIGIMSALNSQDKYGVTPLQYLKYFDAATAESVCRYLRSLNIQIENRSIDISCFETGPSEKGGDSLHPAIRKDYYGRNELMLVAFGIIGGEMRDEVARREEAAKKAESAVSSARSKGMEAVVQAKSEATRAGTDLNSMLSEVCKGLLVSIDQNMSNPQMGGRDALQLACCFQQNLGVVSTLLPHADPTYQDTNGSTALHYAVNSRKLELVDLLLGDPRVAVNIRQRDNRGRTVLHALAMSSGPSDQESIVRLLLQYARDLLSITDSDGNTPLDTARIYNNMPLFLQLQDSRLTSSGLGASLGTPRSVAAAAPGSAVSGVSVSPYPGTPQRAPAPYADALPNDEADDNSPVGTPVQEFPSSAARSAASIDGIGMVERPRALAQRQRSGGLFSLFGCCTSDEDDGFSVNVREPRRRDLRPGGS